MSLLEILILTAVFISIFSIATFFMQHQKKSGNEAHYTYWFDNVDELYK